MIGFTREFGPPQAEFTLTTGPSGSNCVQNPSGRSGRAECRRLHQPAASTALLAAQVRVSDRRPLVVHGGASSRVGDADALVGVCAVTADAGRDAIAGSGSALDATVRILEDDPRLNAGTGAALTATGSIELDASIMGGTTWKAGGVACAGPRPKLRFGCAGHARKRPAHPVCGGRG